MIEEMMAESAAIGYSNRVIKRCGRSASMLASSQSVGRRNETAGSSVEKNYVVTAISYAVQERPNEVKVEIGSSEVTVAEVLDGDESAGT